MDTVTQLYAKQHAATAHLQSKLKYYERQLALRSTPVSSEGSREDEEARADSRKSDGGENSPGQTERKCSKNSGECGCSVSQYTKRASRH